MLVTAQIGDTTCGSTRTEAYNGTIVYVIDVNAHSYQTGCGMEGATVEFYVEQQKMQGMAPWDNRQSIALRPFQEFESTKRPRHGPAIDWSNMILVACAGDVNSGNRLTLTPLTQTPYAPGDGNGDSTINAADITACVLEIFDGDGADPVDAAGGSFPGTAGKPTIETRIFLPSVMR